MDSLVDVRLPRLLRQPPEGLAEHPLWAPRGALIVAGENREAQLLKRFDAVMQHVPTARLLDAKQVLELVPYLAEGCWNAGIYEAGAYDLDVHGIHGAYVTGLRERGALVVREAEMMAGEYRSGVWHLRTSDGQTLQAPTVINAAGAWADEIAVRCGVAKVGVKALRRTVLAIDPHCDVRNTPYLGTVDEDIFIKPEAGRLIVSPCDETLCDPCDVQPDELDLAITMDRLETVTRLRPRAIVNKWAGLRTFVADRSPVLGVDARQQGFIWLAAVGGYGIQAAPAIARLCCHAATAQAMPADLVALGLAYEQFAAERCRIEEFSHREIMQVAELQ